MAEDLRHRAEPGARLTPPSRRALRPARIRPSIWSKAEVVTNDPTELAFPKLIVWGTTWRDGWGTVREAS
jgi:hypothetical protein